MLTNAQIYQVARVTGARNVELVETDIRRGIRSTDGRKRTDGRYPRGYLYASGMRAYWPGS